jgi:choloylglycine hydrolase
MSSITLDLHTRFILLGGMKILMLRRFPVKLVRTVGIIFVLALLLVQRADACTSFSVVTKDGAILIGRSLEFGLVLDSKIMIVPRGFKFTSPAPNGKEGLSWQAKYGFVGMNTKGADQTPDGLNEAGLSVGLLYLAGFAKYQEVGPQDTSRALANLAVGNWMLSNFATVEEVKEAIKNVVVFDYLPPGYGSFPLHFAIYDAKGGALVIEYVNGQRFVYDNPVGVLTNSPPFDWQLTNLRNYINLTNLNVASLKLGNFVLEPLGQGTGLLGVPGDYTPPHRFVRAVALAYASVRPTTAAEGANLAFHILNNVDIPIGVVASKNPAPTSTAGPSTPKGTIDTSGLEYDFTEWVTVRDLTNKLFYFHTYKNLAIRKIDLKKLAFTGTTIQHIDIESGEQFVDTTEKAK